jgi:ribosomal protein S18 acetylase RimI-like enzyme
VADLSGIVFDDDVSALGAADVDGFFEGWPRVPAAERFLRILAGSYAVVLAREGYGGRVVGFVNAISDGELAAHIPLLEVLPEYRHRGIGTELVRRMLDKLDGFAMIDLTCDAELVPYYERFGMLPVSGMVMRDPAAL